MITGARNVHQCDFLWALQGLLHLNKTDRLRSATPMNPETGNNNGTPTDTSMHMQDAQRQAINMRR